MPGRQPIHPGDRPSPSLAAARAAVHDLPVGWISAGRLHGARSEQCGAVESCQNHLAMILLSPIDFLVCCTTRMDQLGGFH